MKFIRQVSGAGLSFARLPLDFVFICDREILIIRPLIILLFIYSYLSLSFYYLFFLFNSHMQQRYATFRRRRGAC